MLLACFWHDRMCLADFHISDMLQYIPLSFSQLGWNRKKNSHINNDNAEACGMKRNHKNSLENSLTSNSVSPKDN